MERKKRNIDNFLLWLSKHFLCYSQNLCGEVDITNRHTYNFYLSEDEIKFPTSLTVHGLPFLERSVFRKSGFVYCPPMMLTPSLAWI